MDIFDAYNEAFPESKMVVFAPDGDLAVIDYANNRKHVMPYDETETEVMDRIRRSKACGRNLFFVEWPVMTPRNDPTVVY